MANGLNFAHYASDEFPLHATLSVYLMSIPIPRPLLYSNHNNNNNASAESIVVHPHLSNLYDPPSNASSLETIHPSTPNLSIQKPTPGHSPTPSNTKRIPSSNLFTVAHPVSPSRGKHRTANSLSVNAIAKIKIPTKPDKNNNASPVLPHTAHTSYAYDIPETSSTSLLTLRKAKSLSDIGALPASDQTIKDMGLSPAGTPDSQSSGAFRSLQRLMRAPATKEPRLLSVTLSRREALNPDQAAVRIQKWWRARAMKSHFERIKAGKTNVIGSSTEGVQQSFTSLRRDSVARVPSQPLFPDTDIERRESVQQRKIKAKGLKLFNASPVKGINFLIDSHYLTDEPASIATYMLQEDRLNKTMLGDFLGTGNQLSAEILRAFLSKMDFRNLLFVPALRKLLEHFRLPGEAQKIDRVMSEFALRYCEQNETAFRHPDTAYILAYSLIMLNTDLHNPAVKKKMSLSDFLRNNKSIDLGNDLPDGFLGNVYDDILQTEIKMRSADRFDRVSEIADLLPDPTMVKKAGRYLIGEYEVNKVLDVTKPNMNRHDRILYLFDDMLLVCKHTKNGRLEPRYVFNLLTMECKRMENVVPNHQNLLDLANANGRLMLMSFGRVSELENFVTDIAEASANILDQENDKKAQLRKITASRADRAKKTLEDMYSQGAQSTKGWYKKFSSLREARTQLQTVTSDAVNNISKKIILAEPSPSVPAEIEQDSDSASTHVVGVVWEKKRRSTVTGYSMSATARRLFLGTSEPVEPMPTISTVDE